MPFTGAATVTPLGKYVTRITGVSLAPLAVGSIGFSTDPAADVKLPADFPTKPDGDTDTIAGGTALTLVDLVEARLYEVAGANTVGVPNLWIDKTVVLGGDLSQITVTNPNGQTATADLEIYVVYLHSAIR